MQQPTIYISVLYNFKGKHFQGTLNNVSHCGTMIHVLHNFRQPDKSPVQQPASDGDKGTKKRAKSCKTINSLYLCSPISQDRSAW